MNITEIETDSNGNSMIEFLHLEKEKFNKIVKLMNSKNVSYIGYQYRVESSAKILWIDEKENSLSILIDNYSSINFIKYINNLIL